MLQEQRQGRENARENAGCGRVTRSMKSKKMEKAKKVVEKRGGAPTVRGRRRNPLTDKTNVPLQPTNQGQIQKKRKHVAERRQTPQAELLGEPGPSTTNISGNMEDLNMIESEVNISGSKDMVDDTFSSDAGAPEVEHKGERVTSAMAISANGGYQDSKAQGDDFIEDDDPQAVAEYENAIYVHLRSIEAKRLPNPRYMDQQRDINVKMREILIDWLSEVHLKFKLRPETNYITVNIIDRFLERRAVSRTKLQLVGCTGMLIASKYEEIYAPEVRDFVYISDKAYTREQILTMESIMLNTLQFNLTVPTALRFAERFLKLLRADDQFKHMVFYYMELTLQEYGFLVFVPSMIAACALYIALLVRDTQTLPDKHAQHNYKVVFNGGVIVRSEPNIDSGEIGVLGYCQRVTANKIQKVTDGDGHTETWIQHQQGWTPVKMANTTLLQKVALWDERMERITTYKLGDIKNCLCALRKLAAKEPTKYRAVRKKYSSSKFLQVAKLPIPPLPFI